MFIQKKEMRFGGHNMKKLFILIGILMIGLTLTACDHSSVKKVAPVFTSATIEGSNPYDGNELKTYYMAKKTDLRVKIELVNNSNFPITAIVVNGIHYSSSRFTDDSTNSVLYFNVDTGTSLGETIYSIDEINYLDGSNSKTVFISDNNEFKVYVYKDIPIVERENYSLNRSSISIDFNITDIDLVIISGSLTAELYSGDLKVSEQVISTGQTNVEFTDLLANKQYDVKVIADYNLDNLDGVVNNVVLYSGPFLTLPNALPSAVISNFNVSSNNVTFDVIYNDEDLVTDFGGLSVVVYQDDVIIREMIINGTVKDVSFEGLLNDSEYTLRVISNYDLRDGLGVVNGNVLSERVFRTLPRIVPEPLIYNLNIEENRISFNLEIDDPTNIIDKSTLVAKLYVDDVLVKQASVFEYSVNLELFDIFSNYEFTIEIEASYDLNDGTGIRENQIIYSEVINTLQNVAPSVEVSNITITQGYVTIDLRVSDINQTLKSSLEVILYENDEIVKIIPFEVEDESIVLEYLVKNSEVYSIDIVADYNLRDDGGTIENSILFRSVLLSLEPKKPAAELLNIETTNDSIMLDVKYMDIDDTSNLDNIKISLYLDGVKIDEQLINIGMNTVEFTGLLSNSAYEIVVSADYNLDDSAGMQYEQVLISNMIITLEKLIPTAVIKNEVSDYDSITFDVIIFDLDSTNVGNSKAVLYQDGIQTTSTIDLTVGVNNDKTFTGLLSDTDYTIEIITDYDLNDNMGVITSEALDNTSIATIEYMTPIATISNDETLATSIVFDVYVEDDDDKSIGNTIVVLYKDNMAISDEITLVDGDNLGLTYNGLLPNNEYEIKIITDYNLLDRTGLQNDVEIESKIFTTTPYALPVTTATDVVITHESVMFMFDYEDIDSVLVDGSFKVSVWTDGNMLFEKNMLSNIISFDISSMIADVDFTIRITADYDLLDGFELIEDGVIFEEEFTILPYEVPTSEVTLMTINTNNIEMEVLITDTDDVIDGNLTAVLYDKDDVELARKTVYVGENDITFNEQINSMEVYSIVIYADYDLLDGEGLHSDQVLEEHIIYQMD